MSVGEHQETGWEIWQMCLTFIKCYSGSFKDLSRGVT